MTAVRPPILVTGAHRSGTTWTANMLALSPGTSLVGREPFNTGPRQWGLAGLAALDYAYVPGLDQGRARRAFGRVLRGAVPQLVGRQGRSQLAWLAPWRHPRVVIKDPLAAMSSEWLAQEFGLDVVVLVRHPAAFAASIARVGWEFDWRTFTAQPALMAGPLAPLRDELQRPPSDPLRAAGLLWRCIYTVLSTYLQRNPDWTLVTHEGMSLQPQDGFRELYARLGLIWNADVERRLDEYTRAESITAPAGRVHELRRDSAGLVERWNGTVDSAALEQIMVAAGPSLVARFYGDAA